MVLDQKNKGGFMSTHGTRGRARVAPAWSTDSTMNDSPRSSTDQGGGKRREEGMSDTIIQVN
jgi:hypothetical protein